MGKASSLVGQKFGRLTVIERHPINESTNNRTRARWICICECGNTVIARTDHLKSGNTVSCGCAKKERVSKVFKTHGMLGTHVHNCWRGMIDRCRNPKNVGWKNYGGRGITVCKEWQTFEGFYKSMGNPPTKSHSIDRLEVNGNYEPRNCRWATPKEQRENQREFLPGNTKYIEFNGEVKSISQWARDLGIPRGTLQARLLYGWSIERALTTGLKLF